MRKIIISITTLLLVLFASCSSTQDVEIPIEGDLATGTVLAGKTTSQICIESGGNWIESANECENISPNFCQEIGGTFNECGSTCRNDPNATICTKQCVQFCSFN
jgi:hypothetical protein